MLQTYQYAPILALISSERIKSYRNIFAPRSDADLYGVYIWAQHASASLYPLAHNLEVTLRNTIDRQARDRFGDFWWQKIASSPGYQMQKFFENIDKARGKLQNEWTKKTRAHLGLAATAPIPAGFITPVWTHDQIIAATDFSTWQFILADAFNSNSAANNVKYLWPSSLGGAFRSYSLIHRAPNDAREGLINIINELREYRNRLFHHEPIWTKGPDVHNAVTAIATIHSKIDKMALMFNAIDRRKQKILDAVGVFSNARRVCSEAELNLYRYQQTDAAMNEDEKRLLGAIAARLGANNETTAWTEGQSLFGIYKIR